MTTKKNGLKNIYESTTSNIYNYEYNNKSKLIIRKTKKSS